MLMKVGGIIWSGICIWNAGALGIQRRRLRRPGTLLLLSLLLSPGWLPLHVWGQLAWYFAEGNVACQEAALRA